jgi:hypothetical protein
MQLGKEPRRMKFEQGDRIISTGNTRGRVFYDQPNAPMFTGTVHRMDKNKHDESIVHIVRDDRKEGMGDYLPDEDYHCWLFYTCDVELTSTSAKPKHAGHAQDKHIAGLSPEAVDWEAHRAFVRNLK